MRRRLALSAFAAALFWAIPASSAPVIQQLTSPSGINIWYVREPTLPIIAVDILFTNAGAATEPDDKRGLASLLSVTLNEGAGDIKSFEFLRRIEELALDLDFDVGTDTFQIDFRTLTENRQEGFELLGLALTQPRFDEGPVGRMRDALLTRLTRRLDDPEDMVGDAWLAAAYPNHPYGRSRHGTIETMETLTPDDLHHYVETRLTRDRLLVGAVGNVEPAEIARLIDIALGGLPETGPRFDIADQPPVSGEHLVVVRQDIPQSTALLGTSGVLREDPDYYAASLLNTVLGGASFISRLWNVVREERGLAYSVGTFLVPLRHSAYVMASVATSNENLGETLDIIRAELDRMARFGLTDEELADAKTYSIGHFALRLDRNSRIASVLVGMQLSGLGPNYLEERAGLINAVTSDDIKRVARRIFLGDENANPDTTPIELITAVAGNPAGFDD